MTPLGAGQELESDSTWSHAAGKVGSPGSFQLWHDHRSRRHVVGCKFSTLGLDPPGVDSKVRHPGDRPRPGGAGEGDAPEWKRMVKRGGWGDPVGARGGPGPASGGGSRAWVVILGRGLGILGEGLDDVGGGFRRDVDVDVL